MAERIEQMISAWQSGETASNCANKRYKGIKRPKCVNGVGCDSCWVKWYAKQADPFRGTPINNPEPSMYKQMAISKYPHDYMVVSKAYMEAEKKRVSSKKHINAVKRLEVLNNMVAPKAGKKKTKAKIDPNEFLVKQLSDLFEQFADHLQNEIPRDVVCELTDLMEDYNTEDNGPIKAIRKAISEWLDGGRI